MDNQRGQWSSKIGFIFAAAGSAIGLGNIWRYPYVVGDLHRGDVVCNSRHRPVDTARRDYAVALLQIFDHLLMLLLPLLLGPDEEKIEDDEDEYYGYKGGKASECAPFPPLGWSHRKENFQGYHLNISLYFTEKICIIAEIQFGSG